MSPRRRQPEARWAEQPTELVKSVDGTFAATTIVGLSMTCIPFAPPDDCNRLHSQAGERTMWKSWCRTRSPRHPSMTARSHRHVVGAVMTNRAGTTGAMASRRAAATF